MIAIPDTIVAISTPAGRGGIGIVRLAGPAALDVVANLVAIEVPLEHGVVRRARVLDPDDPTRSIDDALVTAFLGPRSYTGDTVVEIAAHGSPVILETIVRAALVHGARLAVSGEIESTVRLATPGEFTQRAFLCGRLDLTQAEAVRDLIAAQTLGQARLAARQLGGALSVRIAPAKESLLHLIAMLEAGMDFASGELDDVDVVSPSLINAALSAIAAPLQALAQSFRAGQMLRNGASIALVGRPNAGKSSLFNRLLERERSIVTPLPGTTRDTVEETFAIGGIPVRLIDTAGLRSRDDLFSATIDEPERQGMARSLEALADADLVLFVHAAIEPLRPEEATLATSFANRPHLLIQSKIDLLTAQDQLSREAEAGPWLPTSAFTREGMGELRDAILRQLGAEGALADAGALNTLRQQESITATLNSLAAATAANEARLPHEVLLLDLHAALRALDALTGVTTTDDILGRIFATFCIGK